jgi:hypothetical protein
MDILELIAGVVTAATGLLTALPEVFDGVFSVIYADGDFTQFGLVIISTAGFALAWAGVRLILTYVGKLLSATRGGRR